MACLHTQNCAMQTDAQADRHAARQYSNQQVKCHRPTDIPASHHADIIPGTDIKTDVQTDRQTDMQTDRQTDTNIPTDIQADRQNVQRDGQADRPTIRQRNFWTDEKYSVKHTIKQRA